MNAREGGFRAGVVRGRGGRGAGVMRGRVVLAVLAVVVLLAGLVGCSSRPARPFVPGDLSEAPGAADPSRPVAAVPTARTETVEAAPGVRLVVEWPGTPTPDVTGMIDAFRDHLAGSFKAVVTGGRDVAYLDVVEGDAVRDVNAWVQEFLDERRSVRGTARLYALDVGSISGRGAQLDACVDESGMRLLDSSTGKPVPHQPAWTREPFLQSAGMRLGDDGVWRVALLRHTDLPNERAKGCLR